MSLFTIPNTKGLPVGVENSHNIVTIWFSSPDGDSSDFQMFELRCLNDTQAGNIAIMWSELISQIRNGETK